MKKAPIATVLASVLAAGCSDPTPASPDASADATTPDVAHDVTVDDGGFDATVEDGFAADVAGDVVATDATDATDAALDVGPDVVVSCDGGLTPCNSACVDLNADPKSCGACNHDCLGGACQQGVCQPVSISPIGAFYNLAIDSTYVYWGDGSRIARCSIQGCNPAQTLVTQSGVHDVAVDSTYVYWTNDLNGEVRRALLNGTQQTLLATSVQPTALVVDGGYVYWTSNASPAILQKVPIGGGASSVVGFQKGNTFQLELQGGNLFWTAGGSVYQCATSGCGTTPTLLAQNQPNIVNVAADGTSIYWGGTSIKKCAIGGCNSTPTALASTAAFWVSVDGTDLYFSKQVPFGSIAKCTTTACGSWTTVASNLNQPNVVVPKGNAIYFGTSSAIMKVAK